MNKNLLFLQKSFTMKRFFNAIKIYSSKILSDITKKSFIWGYPPVVMIEPTDICNLKCPLCPSGNGTLKREKGYMSLETYKNAIDQLHPYSFMTVLWNQGEPFLNNDFLKMVKYADQHKMFTLVSTNANFMPNPHDIVKSGLSSIIVSIDGATQETYNKYRVNGDLQKVIDNVKALVKAKKELKSVTPLIHWQFLVMKHNEHEIVEIQELAKSVGVDDVVLKTVQIYTEADIQFLPQNPKYRRYKIEGENFDIKFKFKNQCRRIWTNPVINWNGEVSICCFDKDIKFKIGNIKDTKFYDLWTGEKFQKVRNLILKDRSSIDICRNCGEGVKLAIKNKKVN